MIGIVTIAHGELAREFKNAVEHVVGPQEQFEVICMGKDDTAESRLEDLKNAVKKVDSGKGVIILTDLFGGTPSNLAIGLLEKGKVEVLAGLNLPMLVKLAKARETATLDEAIDAAYEAARKYITIASRTLET